jgi:hypothetical protein
MHEEMVAYLRQNGAASSRDLATMFLKFKSPDERLAHIAISGILSKDRRCLFGKDNLWHLSNAGEDAVKSVRLSDLSWAAFFLLTLGEGGAERPVHASLWSVSPCEVLFDAWLVNPDGLPVDEQEILRSVHDLPFSEPEGTQALAGLIDKCTGRTLCFLSWRQQALFTQGAAGAGVSAPDDGICMRTLFSCAGVPVPRPLSLASCHEALFGTSYPFSYAYRYGECLAKCCQELFERLERNGIVLLSDLAAAETEELASVDFSQKEFSLETITSAPETPGVYGFKDRNNSYLYIGKANNLRRRLMSYFRQSDESPGKLDRIRSDSFSLVTHGCGSELESLLYEYRLIKKHSPILNSQAQVNERSGAHAPVDDCVILLPHAEQDKGMSFWFRKNQKIILRPFSPDFKDTGVLSQELDNFFFSTRLPPNPMDFPEQEIATRWVRRHMDTLCVVRVTRFASGREMADAMKSYWKDLIENKTVRQ